MSVAQLHSTAGVNSMIEDALERLGIPEWNLVSTRRKLGKTIFEVDTGTERLIGKVSDSPRAQGAFEVLKLLWDSGMRPPSRYTVVRPVAFFPERHLLIQEKAPGVQLVDLVRSNSPGVIAGVRSAAEWLACLHSLDVPAQRWQEDESILERCRNELSELAPQQAKRIGNIVSATRMEPAKKYVPSHGDFHPLHVFLAESGRTSAIDLDTFSARDRSQDTGYFLAHLRIMTGGARRPAEENAFLSRYVELSGWQADKARINAQIATAVLRSAHYDLCILKTGKLSILYRWLYAAESALTGSDG